MTKRVDADEALSSLKSQLTLESNLPNLLSLKADHEARAVSIMDELSNELLAAAFQLGVEAGIKLKSENPDL